MGKEAVTTKPKSEGFWGKRMPNNAVTVPTSGDFFQKWCEFLRPIVNLTNTEIRVIAGFLKQRYELSKRVSDPAILDKMVMENETKEKVRIESGITLPHFYVVMNALRKKEAIVNDKIIPRLIPNIRVGDDGSFQLLLLFKEKKAS